MANTNAKGLGKGLGALLGDDFLEETESKGTLQLPLSQIESYANQPRKIFEPEALSDLADSIAEHGVIQPITVRKLQSGYYQIIAGERRWRAAKMAGLTQIPAVVIEADDRTAMELAMIENLQREDLNPLEEAEGYKTLIDQYGLTQEDAAKRVGKSRTVVTNSLRLLNLNEDVKAMVEDGRLSGAHGRAIVSLSPTLQSSVAESIVKNGLSVRQAETMARKLQQEKAKGGKTRKTPTVTVDYTEEAAKELSTALGRSCKINQGRKKGTVELEYYGLDDLNGLLEALYKIAKKK